MAPHERIARHVSSFHGHAVWNVAAAYPEVRQSPSQSPREFSHKTNHERLSVSGCPADTLRTSAGSAGLRG